MKKNRSKRLFWIVSILAGAFIALKALASCVKKRDFQDKELSQKGYKKVGNRIYINKDTLYVKYVKRGMDTVLSFLGLVFLSPLFALISLLIFIDDPGPVLFTQKRVGINKTFIKVHKFRSMKLSTPHDTPTHLLENSDCYITRIGRFLRRYSLDELPQLWDIFLGNLSLVGPRPALWNQDDLVLERDLYGANDLLPGLTGWAQINGRDLLSISAKAHYDGEYCQALRKSSFAGLEMDLRCLFRTIFAVTTHKGVVEGVNNQTCEQNCSKGRSDKDIIGNIGFGERVEPDFNVKKRILITGKTSYIGKSFIESVERNYPKNFEIDCISVRGEDWKEVTFSGYDIVFHLAGIAHSDTSKITEEKKKEYYKVNTELSIELAKKAKADGVGEFIYMSSMIVYGEAAPIGKKKVIDRDTVPKASNFYGDSKLQADIGVRELADENFKVIVLRPPMIYGKGSKGNYPLLSKLAKIAPVFPKVDNERSMLYIGNLCELLVRIMLVEFEENSVVLLPQNAEWTNTCRMVRRISEAGGKRLLTLSLINPAVYFAGQVPGKMGRLVNKAFGNFVYAHEISKYEGIQYQFTGLEKSVVKTETDYIPSDVRPLVSIITVSHNSEKTIRRTIESVLAQSYGKLEYRIVDGLSSDKTVDIAMEYAPLFAARGIGYHVTSEKDKGIYDAMNKGIGEANGSIIGIINSDDWYEKNAVETMISTYNRTGFDYYFADVNLIKKDGSVIVKRAKNGKMATSRHWNHPSSFVTKETYNDLGEYRNSGIHDDFDFYLRVRKAGFKIVAENKTIANFSMGGISNKKTFEDCKKRCRDRYCCYKNNGYSSLYIVECLFMEAAKYLLS